MRRDLSLNKPSKLVLIALYHRIGQYSEALELVEDVIRQLKRLDDKAALIEVHLLESRIYFALKNIAKARAALTSASYLCQFHVHCTGNSSCSRYASGSPSRRRTRLQNGLFLLYRISR